MPTAKPTFYIASISNKISSVMSTHKHTHGSPSFLQYMIDLLRYAGPSLQDYECL